MPMGSEQSDPANLPGWEPWLQAPPSPGWGEGVLSLCPRPFCWWPPGVIGSLQAMGQYSQLLVTCTLVGLWPYLASQLKMGRRTPTPA